MTDQTEQIPRVQHDPNDPTQVLPPSGGPQREPLHGIVIDTGESGPISTAKIRATGPSGHETTLTTSTDTYGRFSTPPLPAGTYQLAVTANGWFTSHSQVNHRTDAAPVTIELDPAELNGRIFAEATSEPVLNATLQLRTLDGTLVGQASTGPTGRFRIPHIALDAPEDPDGYTHTLTIAADKYKTGSFELALRDTPTDTLSFSLTPTKTRWPLIAGAALIVTMAVLAMVVLLSSEAVTVDVPDVTTTSVADAARVLDDAELTLGEITTVESDEPSGSVLTQDPEAGSTVEVGTEIAVDVATAPDKVEIPNMVGFSRDDAESELDELGLTLGTIEERPSAEQDLGTVLATTPGRGQQVEPGSPVSLTLATEPPEQTARVPSLVGQDESDALALLNDAGFAIEIVREHASQDEGVVTIQDPGAGAEAPVRTAVTITVSRGPEPTPTPTPDPEPEPSTDPTDEPEPAGEDDPADEPTSIDPDPDSGQTGTEGESGFPAFSMPDIDMPDIDFSGLGDRIADWFADLFAR